MAAFLQQPQRVDYRRKFHAVIGGVGVAAVYLLFGAVIAQNSTPAARAGVTGAGAVGKNIYVFQSHLGLSLQ